jgi:hypothetical protein
MYLVGVAHIGTKEYYSQIQAVLDARSIVLFEGVRPKTGKPVPPKNDPKASKPIYQILGDAVGLDFQLTDINYQHPNWINSDLSMEELERLNRKGGKGKPTGFDNVQKMLDPNSPQTKMLGQFFKTAPASVKEALKIFLVEKLAKVDTILAATLDPTTLNVLLTARNQSILDTLEKVLEGPQPTKSIAIFYGAAHLTEVQKAVMAKYGYRPQEQTWFTFAKADRRKLDATGRQFLDTLGTMAKGF